MTVYAREEISHEVRKLEQSLIAKFAHAGRPLSAAALRALRTHLQDLEKVEQDKQIEAIISKLVTNDSLTVSRDELDEALGDVEVSDKAEDLVQVIDPFQQPRPLWDAARRHFHAAHRPALLFPEALAKPHVYRLRLCTVAQRVHRSPRFRGSVLGLPGQSANRPGVQLTAVQALLGSGNASRVVLGMLRRIEGTSVVLEDESGHVPISLSRADCSAVRGFLSDGSCFLVEGCLRPNGVFEAQSIADPPTEPRADALLSLQGFDMNGVSELKPEVAAGLRARGFEDLAQRLVFLYGCWLVQPAVLRKLSSIFQGYEDLPEGPPAMFVFIGPFTAPADPADRAGDTASDSPAKLTAAFAALASVLAVFSNIQAQSKIVLVPGKGDAGDFGILPQRPLLDAVTRPLSSCGCNVELASNPCRIKFYNKHIVVFAGRPSRTLQQNVLRPFPDRDYDKESTFRYACHTLLRQCHLSPFPMPVQPVHWHLDSALSLFPQPDVLVIGGFNAWHSMKVDDVRCVSPGLLSQGAFLSYIPCVPSEGAETPARPTDDTDAAAGQADATDGVDSASDGVPESLVEDCFVEDDDEDEGSDDDQVHSPGGSDYEGYLDEDGYERQATEHGNRIGDDDSEDDFSAGEADRSAGSSEGEADSQVEGDDDMMNVDGFLDDAEQSD